ncbi:F-box-like domain superfamily [Arabidopsis suecica]|uniref:F-box-like domain superfamily n=1 Tax=Arabidopsis suecica TaxID=45249 RepID=A0A8T2HH91_ARASU|nr:F-box-like domain superfamily [Arabidopsis suecica]
MTMMMSDLPNDLVEEILSRVPITSLGAVRSTCKRWNGLSKDRIVCKGDANQQFTGFTRYVNESTVCSMRLDLNEIQNEDVELVELSINKINKFIELELFQVYYSDGLLLLVTDEVDSKIVVWNPYLGQTRLIQCRDTEHFKYRYALGYDNNRNHKILMYNRKNCEIYDFKSDSWKVLDIIPDLHTNIYVRDMSIKGNTYFFYRGEKIGEGLAGCLLSFDFTRERFVSCLPLPFQIAKFDDNVALSSAREEHLVVLFNNWEESEMEIWVTTKIEPNAVSWSNFLTFTHFRIKFLVTSFFIDQEKKLAVVFGRSLSKQMRCNIAYTIGDNGYLRILDFGVTFIPSNLPVSYAPSLVKITQGQELSVIEEKKRSRLLASLVYSTLFVSFIIFFSFISSVFI